MNDDLLSCPACRTGLVARDREGIRLEVCPACHGVWAGTEAWTRILVRRRDLAIDQPASTTEAGSAPAVDPGELVRYRPCPACGERMNRMHAGSGSGVLIDRCLAHGTWFDAGELERVREYVRSGAWERARAAEIARLRASGVRAAGSLGPGLDSSTWSDRFVNWVDFIELPELIELVAILFDW